MPALAPTHSRTTVTDACRNLICPSLKSSFRARSAEAGIHSQRHQSSTNEAATNGRALSMALCDGDACELPGARRSLWFSSATPELAMNDNPTHELIIRSAAAALTAALAMQNAFTASLVSTLIEKGLFTPDEIRALLVRAADKSSS